MKARFLIVAVLGGILLVPPAAAEPPASFIRVVYAQYKSAAELPKNFDPCREFCTADFAKLIKAAKAKKVLDYDPICQCQKGGDAFMMFSGSRGATDDDYFVTMKKVGKPGTWVVVLKWTDGEWKIADIRETRNGKQTSLRDRLKASGV